MKKFFIVSLIFLIIGVGSLTVALYLFKMHRYQKPASETVTSEGVEGGKGVAFTKYKKPEIVDRSTPDKTIQSYWEYLDYVRSAKREPEIKRYKDFTRAYDEYLAGIKPVEQNFIETFLAREASEERSKRVLKPEPYFADLMEDPRKAIQIKYRRVIKEVKFESDTRAKVEGTVYNVTPVENLKQRLTEEDATKRADDFVYTMEKFQDGWKIINKEWKLRGAFFDRYIMGDYYYVDPNDN